MKISKRSLEKYSVGFLLFLFTVIIYFGLCKLFGVDIMSDLDAEDDGGRFPRGGSFFAGISFFASYLILSRSIKAIVNLKSKKQQDEYLNEFYNFKQRYYRQLSKSSYLYRKIDEIQKKHIDSYKWLVNISDFNDIYNYKKSTYEIIRQGLIDSIYSFGSFRNEDFNTMVDLYKEMLKDRSVFAENDSIKYLREIDRILT